LKLDEANPHLADISEDQNGYVPSQEDLITFGLAGTPQLQMAIHSPQRAWEFWSTPFAEGFQTSVLNGGFATNASDVMPEEALDQDIEMQHQELFVNRQSAEVLSPSDFNLPPPVQNVERIWFMRMHTNDDDPKLSPTTTQATPPVTQYSEFTDVDDQYRLQMSKAVLTPQPSDDPLPSSDFLVP
jgi:hypothetical protein